MVPCADFTQGMEKKEIIRTLQSHAPLIFDVMMTDLGCEFSAVSKDGIVFRNAGMLLSTETEGHMPEWWGGEVSDNKEYEGMVENYLNELPIIPWNQVAQDDLVELLNEIENLEGNEE